MSSFQQPTIIRWTLARRTIELGEKTLIMGVLNATPDSFSDGGRYASVAEAVRRAEEMIAQGAHIIDIGGESTRPGAAPVPEDEELRRVIPVVEAIRAAQPDALLSLDTTKSAVARAGLASGAHIINDVSALRFDAALADAAARAQAGLILMHSRGAPQQMHGLEPVPDIMAEVAGELRRAASAAAQCGVAPSAIVLDPGIGFGKSDNQNLALLANLDALAHAMPGFPLLIGTSRKSFIGRLLDGAPAERRLHGTMASITAAILAGAHIVRVHDVAAAAETARVADAIKSQKFST